MSAALQILPSELVRQSTDIANLCKEIVIASAVVIQERKYVRVEGWQSIATAHGCVASACDVHKVEGGMVATGQIRRMADGQLIATAEGFVGEDEPTWYGGDVEKDEWTGPRGQRKKTGKKIIQTLPKRAEYAIRAMAQTRAISRACRSAFAHVVVLMDAGLSTTPAEEVPEGGFNDSYEQQPKQEPAPQPAKPALSDEEAKAGNIERLRAFIHQHCPEADRLEYEQLFCQKAASVCTDPKVRATLDEFTLEELRLIFTKHKMLMRMVVEAATAATSK